MENDSGDTFDICIELIKTLKEPFLKSLKLITSNLLKTNETPSEQGSCPYNLISLLLPILITMIVALLLNKEKGHVIKHCVASDIHPVFDNLKQIIINGLDSPYEFEYSDCGTEIVNLTYCEGKRKTTLRDENKRRYQQPKNINFKEMIKNGEKEALRLVLKTLSSKKQHPSILDAEDPACYKHNRLNSAFFSKQYLIYSTLHTIYAYIIEGKGEVDEKPGRITMHMTLDHLKFLKPIYFGEWNKISGNVNLENVHELMQMKIIIDRGQSGDFFPYHLVTAYPPVEQKIFDSNVSPPCEIMKAYQEHRCRECTSEKSNIEYADSIFKIASQQLSRLI